MAAVVTCTFWAGGGGGVGSRICVFASLQFQSIATTPLKPSYVDVERWRIAFKGRKRFIFHTFIFTKRFGYRFALARTAVLCCVCVCVFKCSDLCAINEKEAKGECVKGERCSQKIR